VDEAEDIARLLTDQGLLRLGAVIEEWQQLATRRLDPDLEKTDPADEARFWRLTAEGVSLFADLVVRTMAAGTPTPIPVGVTHLLHQASVGILDGLAGDIPLAWTSEGKPKTRRVTRYQRIAQGYASAYFALVKVDNLFPTSPPTQQFAIVTISRKHRAKLAQEENLLQREAYLRLFTGLSGPPEDLPRLRLEAAQKLLKRAGRMYRRRVG
jgi:hypothetical protein